MKTLSSFIALLLLANVSARAEVQRAVSSDSLRGLNGVYVICQLADAQPEGVTSNSLTILVKTMLAEANIPVDAVPKKFNGDAKLSITVNTIKQTQLDAYIFTVSVEVAQDVKLARLPKSEWLMATTWRREIQGFTTPDHPEVIEQVLKTLVAAFVKEYRAVNPVK